MTIFYNVRALGLEPAFEMVSGPPGRTFFYRQEHKRVIEPRVVDEHRLRRVPGPLLYVVTDSAGALRYVGKWVSSTPLFARWFRHEHIHHQTSSRTRYLAELDEGRSPLLVWSLSTAELRPRLPRTELNHYDLAEAMEALWISRWKPQLWNKNRPAVPAGEPEELTATMRCGATVMAMMSGHPRSTATRSFGRQLGRLAFTELLLL